MKINIFILACLVATAALAEKIVYETSSGKIISVEPDAARVVDGTLESKVVSRPDWTKRGFGSGTMAGITTQTVVRPIYNAQSNLVGAVTNFYTSKTRRSNVSELPDFQKLWPLTADDLQKIKPLARRQFENKYLKYCDTLTATTNHTSLTIAQLKTKWQTLTAAEKATTLIEFILLNLEGQKEGGSDWLADCTWHPEAEK